MIPDASAAPAAKGPLDRARAWFAALIALFALAEGGWVLYEWVSAGTAPGARAWSDPFPMAACAGVLILAAVTALRRAPLERCAYAALAWAFAMSVCAELPLVAHSHEYGDGPWLRWVYLGLGSSAGIWAASGRKFDARSTGIALLVFWSAGNARLWGRDADRIWVLLWAALLLVLVARGERAGWRTVGGAFGRPLAAITLAMLAWFALATWNSDCPSLSTTAWLRVAWGALVAYAIASVGRSALGASFSGALAAAAALGLVLSVGLLEALPYTNIERVFGSRLRLLGMHSNGIGPLLGVCLCLIAARLIGVSSGTSARVARARMPEVAGWLAISALLAFGLWRSESRASILGVFAGFATLGWCVWGRLTARIWLFGSVGLLLLALVLGLLATPLADGLHARLEALTMTQSAIGQRYYMWNLAARVLAEHPWFGAGPNVYYLHAQYAYPSFYDLTPQVMHSHSLYVGIAEGSGWLGLLLFLLLCIGSADLLRRALVAADSQPLERARIAGWAAALAVVLASSLLDVGQGRNSFVPLLSWCVPGALAAWLVSNSSTSSAASGARATGAALVAFVGLCAAPALSFHATHAARTALREQRHEDTLALSSFALALWPLETDVRLPRFAAQRALGRGDLALEELRAMVAAHPSAASQYLNLAPAELELGDPLRAKQAALEALRLDPLGQDSGTAAFALAAACLRLGEREQAEAALLQGLRTEGNGWRNLPQIRVPARGSAEGFGQSVAFVLGDRAAPSAYLELDDLLAQLEQEVRRDAATRSLPARRLAGRLVELLRGLGKYERALALIDAYESASGFNNGSFSVIRLELYADLARAEDADHIRNATAWGSDGHVVAMWARAQLAAGGAERVQRVFDAAPLFESFGNRDISFDAGKLGPHLALGAQIALQRGELDHAIELLERARYDCAGPQARLGISQPFLSLCAKTTAGREAALAALRLVLADAALDAGLSRNEQAMRQRARLVREACDGDLPSEAEIDAVCRGLGAAGETFRQAWRSKTEEP